MEQVNLVLESDITGLERAIRHLIGEKKAINSKLTREEAILKLDEAKRKALSTVHHHSVGVGGTVPHGIRFPDISNNQPHADFSVIARAKSVRVGQLAVTKLTEGIHFIDSYGLSRLNEMASCKILHRGAYCFGHPSVGGMTQADYFMRAGGHILTASDIIIYDCEVTDGESPNAVAGAAKDFSAFIRKQSPAKLWLYGGGPFLHENGVSIEGYNAHWVAAYVGDPEPYMIFGKNKTVAWQFTDGVHGPTPHAVPGIGSCDISIIL